MPLEMAPQAQVGDQLDLYTHIPAARVRATCKKVGKHAYLWVDNAVLNLVWDAALTDIINEFDNRIYPKCHEWFGTEWKPGLDMDARIFLLLHDVEGNGSGAGFGGYFSPQDEMPTALYSNRREIVYVDVYYPKQRRNVLYPTIAHEFTHMLNWFQNGGSVDEHWLEEGVACFAEWAIYRNIHWIYVDGFLNEPTISLTSSNTHNNRYGASFLFLLYLYEKYGGRGTIKEIVAQNKRGIAAINAALKARGYQERFREVFNRWTIANLLNDTRQNTLYGYENIAPKRKIPRLAEVIETNYPVQRAGTLDAWAAKYVTFERMPETMSIFFDGDSAGFFDVQAVRISPDGNISVTALELDAENNGAYQVHNLRSGERLTLIFSASTGGAYRYEAAAELPANIAIDEPRRDSILTDEPLQYTQPIGSVIHEWTQEQLGGQEIRIIGDVHLSSNYIGICINGAYAYLASEWGLEIFDLSTPSSPLFIGEIPTPGSAENVCVQGDYAYLADGEAGLHIIDIALPHRPQLVATYRRTLKYAHKIQVIGDNAYVVDLETGVHILDVSDARNPRLVGQYQPKGRTLTAEIFGRYAYVTDAKQGFQILDISVAENPQLLGSADITGYDVAVIGNHAYVANGSINILDIRNPRQPRIIVENISTPGNAHRVHAAVHEVNVGAEDEVIVRAGVEPLRNEKDSYLYTADAQGGISILDVRDVRHPRLMERQYTSGHAWDIATQGDYAYIADSNSGLQTIDISNPSQPRWVHQYDTGGYAGDVKVIDGYAYIADGASGLRIVDVRDVSTATLRASYPVASKPSASLSKANSIDVHANYAYIAGEGGLHIIDVRNIHAPQTVKTIPTPEIAWGVTVAGNYAYVAADDLVVVDISNPENAKIIATHPISGYAYKIRVVENDAYIAALDGGIQILDITKPQQLNIVGRYDTGDIAKSVRVTKDYAYVAESKSGLQIIDIRNPKQPQLMGVYLTDAETVDVQIARGYAYLLGRERLEILSLEEKTDPQLIAQVDDFKWAGGMYIDDKLIFVADGYNLKIFRFDLKAPWSVEEEELNSYHKTESSVDEGKTTWRYQLGQNYPNPNPKSCDFGYETWIPYQLAAAGDVTIRIYNIKGEIIRVLHLGPRSAGAYLNAQKSAYWDGKNNTGENVASGIYFYQIAVNDFTATKKLMVQK